MPDLFAPSLVSACLVTSVMRRVAVSLLALTPCVAMCAPEAASSSPQAEPLPVRAHKSSTEFDFVTSDTPSITAIVYPRGASEASRKFRRKSSLRQSGFSFGTNYDEGAFEAGFHLRVMRGDTRLFSTVERDTLTGIMPMIQVRKPIGLGPFTFDVGSYAGPVLWHLDLGSETYSTDSGGFGGALAFGTHAALRYHATPRIHFHGGLATEWSTDRSFELRDAADRELTGRIRTKLTTFYFVGLTWRY